MTIRDQVKAVIARMSGGTSVHTAESFLTGDLTLAQVKRAIRDIPGIRKNGNGYSIRGRKTPDKK